MKKDGKEFAMKELMSTSRQASKAAEKEANMLLFLGIYRNGSLEFQLEYCLQRRRNFETLNIVIFVNKYANTVMLTLISNEIIDVLIKIKIMRMLLSL